jgi:hypothetical protein
MVSLPNHNNAEKELALSLTKRDTQPFVKLKVGLRKKPQWFGKLTMTFVLK